MSSREHAVGGWAQLAGLGADDPALGGKTAGEIVIGVCGKSLKRAAIVTTLLADARACVVDVGGKGIECNRSRDAPCGGVEGSVRGVDCFAVTGNEGDGRLVQRSTQVVEGAGAWEPQCDIGQNMRSIRNDLSSLRNALSVREASSSPVRPIAVVSSMMR